MIKYLQLFSETMFCDSLSLWLLEKIYYVCNFVGKQLTKYNCVKYVKRNSGGLFYWLKKANKHMPFNNIGKH